MKREKIEKLILIGPSGKEYEVGFMSPCAEGMVIGAAQIGDKSPPHLTVLKKDEQVSSHITYQDHSAKRQWFPPMTTEDMLTKFQALIDKGIVFQIGQEDHSTKVIFLTKRLADWFEAFMAAFYQKMVSEKKVIHVFNFKNLFEMLPDFISEVKKQPNDFFGLCQIKDLIEDNSKVLGISETGLLILRAENELIGMRMDDLLGASFMGVPRHFKVRAP